jgi:hypothetical protein
MCRPFYPEGSRVESLGHQGRPTEKHQIGRRGERRGILGIDEMPRFGRVERPAANGAAVGSSDVIDEMAVVGKEHWSRSHGVRIFTIGQTDTRRNATGRSDAVDARSRGKENLSVGAPTANRERLFYLTDDERRTSGSADGTLVQNKTSVANASTKRSLSSIATAALPR